MIRFGLFILGCLLVVHVHSMERYKEDQPNNFELRNRKERSNTGDKKEQKNNAIKSHKKEDVEAPEKSYQPPFYIPLCGGFPVIVYLVTTNLLIPAKR